MIQLPADILLLICEELGNQQEFATLFNCALAGKTLVGSSLLWLYRNHDQWAKLRSEGNDANFAQETFQARVTAQKQDFLKWALQWKSIIRSSFGETIYPYCLYIRSLDLRNLADFLEDPLFRDTAFESFFEGSMTRFLKSQETPMKQKMRGAKASYKRLDVPAILEGIGESITKFVSESASKNNYTVTVEDLSGHISAGALPNWVSRLSKLRSLTLWDGGALSGRAGEAISTHCREFDDLTFFTCLRDNADHDLSSFLSSLNKNTLRSFTAIGAGSVGPDTLLAMNHHSQSLRKLKLDGLKSGTVKNLALLKDCTSLESLEISDADGSINLEATENDVFLEVVSWLGQCHSMRELLFRNLVSGPAILTQVCLKNTINLRKLQVIGYPMVGSQAFHAALSHQTTLESLELRADPEGAFRDDIDTLITSISQLARLQYLDLLSTSDYFKNTEILILSSHLENLEELSFSGYDVTDDLWRGLANLRSLRILNIHAVSSFSVNGMLAYIGTLQASNRGLNLSVMNQKTENAISEQDENLIRESIAASVDGKFDFTLYRDPDSESESLSD